MFDGKCKEQNPSGDGRALTIAIPTFNRAAKLERLLAWLERELSEFGLTDRISILVANNASSDDTGAVLSNAAGGKLHLKYFTNSENLGFDGNILSLYQRVETQYLWFMSDDDTPLSGAVTTVLQMLDNHRPDVLLMPFIQPPGSWRAEYEFAEPYRVFADPGLAADVVMQIGKVSVYLLRLVRLSEAQLEEALQYNGVGYMFQVLALTVLGSSPALKLLLLSKPAVTSDNDFFKIPWNPAPILDGYRICSHSFVRTWAPNLLPEKRRACYIAMIRFLWDGQIGNWIAGDPKAWDNLASQLEWRWPDLCRHPVMMIRLLIVKLHLGYLLQRGPLAAFRVPARSVSRYFRTAEWLTSARCQFRRTRDYFRRRRVFGTPR